ncbi:phosphatase PAP2 family protein [Comamonas endophytica]|uniref:Phosphatase PAP2 family protein n=1 Tax=Comamonas endophytica TaxID=2949090 RepID=A0ABY6GFJ4_9BURK|nr:MULTISPECIES: phosphatase PAP2 family protein [unclassified Acidovorax]MCD2513371.1 phosphatase PAP2 family protein [Acidovorax sp. D4N7]UYG53846.1 phosphatase PAP2 family protein [Acidovorax sp. 5MLIR]
MNRYLDRQRLGALAVFCLIALWDASGLDTSLARLAGSSAGFPLRDSWILSAVFHDGARHLAWLGVLALAASTVWPWGPFRDLPFARRLQLAFVTLAASGVIALLKIGNHTSCPWDLQQFGGVATPVSHWAGWLRTDGGGGHCFPAGHASTGFAFIAGYFALRADKPELARIWLACSIALGLLLGGAQQLRGAHFMSHTLWTGWICWLLGWITDPLFSRRMQAAPGSR